MATSQENKILFEKCGNVLIITLNRPKKKNAITLDMYEMITERLNEADKDPDIKVVVFTGAGNVYSSGNDLSNFSTSLMSGENGSMEALAEKARVLLVNFVTVFINFSKILIAAVNGPAIGIMFTLLPLFDMVIADPSSTFKAPFSSLGQTPEGCSTFTFPIIFGKSKASEILILGEQLTAQEALAFGLASQLSYAKPVLNEAVLLAKKFAHLPQKSVTKSKEMMNRWNREMLRTVNEEECWCLKERWQSDDCLEAVFNFLNRKSKL